MPDVSIVEYETPYVPTSLVADGQQSALALISQLLMLKGVSEKHLKEQLSIGLWKWTEASGVPPNAKYNLRYVSEGVRRPEGPVSINHEHVWTKMWMIERLRARKTWPIADLRTFLETYGVACVVTVDEHARLGGVVDEGWDRYRRAGIRVWDRMMGRYLDLDEPLSSVPHGAPRPDSTTLPLSGAQSVPQVFDLVGEKAAPDVADRLRELLRMARFASATAVPSLTKRGEVAPYFRIHDNLLGEPTPAVAYPHWSGRVAYRLVAPDLPAWLADDQRIQVLKHDHYALQVRIEEAPSLALAEELLLLALEKLRGEYSD